MHDHFCELEWAWECWCNTRAMAAEVWYALRRGKKP